MKHVFSAFSDRLCRHVILLLTLFLFATSAFADAFFKKTRPFACPIYPVLQDPKAALSENDIALRQKLYVFAEEMEKRHGFDRHNLSCLFSRIRHNSKAIDLVRPPAFGTVRNWRAYRARFMTASRISAGARFWQKHEKALERAENHFGVPAEIIVGIIGVETTYGRNKGGFCTLDVLATLAFDYPEHPKREARVALFKRELEQFLILCSKQHTDPFSIKGSYAGAIGWPQFLPSSIRKYAIDFDGDGAIDLENSSVDAIGSIARFLTEHGWQKNMPVIFPAEFEHDCAFSPDTALGKKLTAELTAPDLEKICILPDTARPEDLLYGLVDLPNGTESIEYRLGTSNFFAITHYNRSFFYAMSVIELGRAVKTLYEKNRNKSVIR